MFTGISAGIYHCLCFRLSVCICVCAPVLLFCQVFDSFMIPLIAIETLTPPASATVVLIFHRVIYFPWLWPGILCVCVVWVYVCPSMCVYMHTQYLQLCMVWALHINTYIPPYAKNTKNIGPGHSYVFLPASCAWGFVRRSGRLNSPRFQRFEESHPPISECHWRHIIWGAQK